MNVGRHLVRRITQAPPDSTNTSPRYTLMVPSVTTMGGSSR